MGLDVVVLFTHGASVRRKRLDAPESNIAQLNFVFSLSVIFGRRDAAAKANLPRLPAPSGCITVVGVGVEDRVGTV